MIIGDSYNCCVVPYLALSIEQVDIIDRRYFDGSIINYIEKTNPDIVLSACTPTEIDGANHHRALLNFE